MYRIFCESFKNYKKLFSENDAMEEYRYKITKPFELIIDIDKYVVEKRNESNSYKQLSDLIFHMEQNTKEYPMFKAFLWTLESRDITSMNYGIVPIHDLNEQSKLIKMFLGLLYWDEAI